MISEAFKYLTTPCPAHIRSMGYLKELIALEARFARCKVAWQPHLAKTKSLITEAVCTVPQNKKAVVLGAGILADIPIETLSENFETVVLVDVCFLNKTRKSIRAYANIKCQTCDITGITGPLYTWTKNREQTDALPVPSIPDAISLTDADLVISANILSQLPLIPVSYVRKKRPALDEATIQKFACDIISSHVEFLKTCPGTVCLVSEVERQFCDGQNILDSVDPLWGCSLGVMGEMWDWDIAPKAETSADFDVRHRVSGAYWYQGIKS